MPVCNSLKEVNEKMIPFTGRRSVNFEVVCADPKKDTMYFSPSSIFCKKEEDYLTQCKELNLTPGKKYKVVAVYGVGDLFDLIIEKDDTGNKAEIMDAYFRDINE